MVSNRNVSRLERSTHRPRNWMEIDCRMKEPSRWFVPRCRSCLSSVCPCSQHASRPRRPRRRSHRTRTAETTYIPASREKGWWSQSPALVVLYREWQVLDFANDPHATACFRCGQFRRESLHCGLIFQRIDACDITHTGRWRKVERRMGFQPFDHEWRTTCENRLVWAGSHGLLSRNG